MADEWKWTDARAREWAEELVESGNWSLQRAAFWILDRLDRDAKKAEAALREADLDAEYFAREREK